MQPVELRSNNGTAKNVVNEESGEFSEQRV